MRASILLLASLLASCGDAETPEQKEAAARLLARDNQIELDHPDVVGKLPDGRTLYHSMVRTKDSYYVHNIYYAGTDLTVNTGGKSPTTHVVIGEPQVIVIDGRRYGVEEVEKALTRDKEQRRKEK